MKVLKGSLQETDIHNNEQGLKTELFPDNPTSPWGVEYEPSESYTQIWEMMTG